MAIWMEYKYWRSCYRNFRVFFLIQACFSVKIRKRIVWILIKLTLHETRYLAPEYLDAGNLTYKVDVYAFGIVLIELITCRRISELEQFNGHSHLSEWFHFHPLHMLEPNHILQNIVSLNPCMNSEASLEFNLQLQAMARAASLCLRPDPDARPPISKVWFTWILLCMLVALWSRST